MSTMTAQWLSVLPPLAAIAVVLWRQEVIVALVLAIFTSELLQLAVHWHAPMLAGLNTVEQTVAVFSDAGNTRILIFSLMIGALLALVRESGGVTALVNSIIRLGIARNARQTALMTSAVGTAVFVESNLSVLTSGILSRGLFDKFGMSRARLAYFIDSTSAPICILILLNAWGAYVLALLSEYSLEGGAAKVLWETVPFNFYALITLLIVFFTAWTGKVFGPLARTEGSRLAVPESTEQYSPTHPAYMLAPLLALITAMVGFMFWTGGGVLDQGSGSKSVLYAVSLACLVSYSMMIMRPEFSHIRLIGIAFKGMSELLPLVAIVLFSLALGSSLKSLGTGVFIAGLVGEFLPAFLVVPMVFLAGALISFSTGTSWGTFAILIPIAVPLIGVFDLPPSLVLAAVLGGGVFGDHCSPISDTTAISAIASGCDLLEHVRTQLPYALVSGGLALVVYTLVSFVYV